MKDKISKLWYVLKKDGLIVFIKKSFAYIIANYFDRFSFRVLLNKKKYRKNIEEILRLSSYERIIVWRSRFGYNVPLFQRPQHIANSFAKNGCIVFYEVTSMTDRVKTIKKVKENLFLVNFNNHLLNKIFMEEVNKRKEPKYLQLYSTDWRFTLDNMNSYLNKGYRLLYEYIDELSASISGTKELPKNIGDKFEFAMKHKDSLIVVTASRLEEHVKMRRGNANLVFSSNGVDYDFFQEFDINFSFDEDFKSIMLANKPIIVYYGALENCFYYFFLKKINDSNKYTVVLFGVKYDSSFDDNNIGELKNVYFLGQKDYKILKYYARECDILTIPFKINEITESTSPLKIYEYMALHKPIVITDLRECREFESVLIGKDHEEFLEKLDEAYSLKNDKKYIELLDKEARVNDWSVKAKAILNLLKNAEEGDKK